MLTFERLKWQTRYGAQEPPQRIAVIGNAGGGKTTLSRKLSKIYQLPLTHVDSHQFTANMQIRPHHETISILKDIQVQSHWVIDGFGPLDILLDRLEQADLIVFVDLPLWRHVWWSALRQLKNLIWPRQELPLDCQKITWAQTTRLMASIWKTHQKMRPELIRILYRPSLHPKLIHLQKTSDLKID